MEPDIRIYEQTPFKEFTGSIEGVYELNYAAQSTYLLMNEFAPKEIRETRH